MMVVFLVMVEVVVVVVIVVVVVVSVQRNCGPGGIVRCDGGI